MITLGLILIILALLLGVPVLQTIGSLLLVVGLILALLGALDRGVGGRQHWY